MGKVKILNKIKDAKPTTDEDNEIDNIVLPEKDLLEKRSKKAEIKKKRSETGVVLLEGIPHGFYEKQINEYFSQFGEVRRIRVGRSRKTGNSKGYAFVEFTFPEVAQIAAESMNNYMMFKQVLRTKYIPPSEQHPRMFGGRIKMDYFHGHLMPKQRIKTITAHTKANNSLISKEATVKRSIKQIEKLNKLKEMYNSLDLDFDINEILPEEKIKTMNEYKHEKIDKKESEKLKRKEKKGAAVKTITHTEDQTTVSTSTKKAVPAAQKVKAEKSTLKIEEPTASSDVKVEKKKAVLSGRIEKKKTKVVVKKECLQLAVKQIPTEQNHPKVTTTKGKKQNLQKKGKK